MALNPDAVRVMKEAGVDISGHRSKNVSEFLGQRFTYVITVCDSARQACSVFPGASRTLHWNLDDPAAARGTQEEHLSVFRRVRDEIETHIRGFIAPASQQLH